MSTLTHVEILDVSYIPVMGGAMVVLLDGHGKAATEGGGVYLRFSYEQALTGIVANSAGEPFGCGWTPDPSWWRWN